MAAFEGFREHEGVLYISGQLPFDANGELYSEKISEQVEAILANIVLVGKEFGITKDDILKTDVFLTDINFSTEVNAAYENYFTERKPARSLFGVTELVRGAQVEIDAIVAVRR